jgi:hypothetical protein
MQRQSGGALTIRVLALIDRNIAKSYGIISLNADDMTS